MDVYYNHSQLWRSRAAVQKTTLQNKNFKKDISLIIDWNIFEILGFI